MTIHQFISVLLIFLHRSLPSVGLFNLHVQTSLNLITTMCSVMWATLKTYFHTFLLVQVSAGSETNHLITLIPIYALELMAAVWEVFGQKKREFYIYVYIYIFCCACLMSIDICVTMCHDLLHGAGETALRSTLFFTNTFHNDDPISV